MKVMKNTAFLPLLGLTAAIAFGIGWIAKPAAEVSDKLETLNKASDRSATSSRGNFSGGESGGPERDFIKRYLTNGQISPDDMKSAIAEMSKVNDPLLRQKMFAALLENLTAENAKDAFIALRENRGGRGPGGRARDQELSLLANAWGRIDGLGAMTALSEIAELGDGNDRGWGGRGGRGPGGMTSEMVGALSGWATEDGAAAIAHYNELEDGEQKGYLGYGVIQGLLVNGVDEALGFVQGLPDSDNGRAKEFYMGAITSEMLEQGVDTAKNWINSVNDPGLKSGAIARVVMDQMGNDREGMAAWLVEFDGAESERAAGRLAESWAREEPLAVLEWASQLSGEAKSEAYEEAMESWVREDPIAAGEHLGTLAPSPERDAATEEYATHVSREDAPTAMDWAGTIQDAELRRDTELEVAEDWYRSDKVAAEEWMATANLTVEEIERVTEPRQGGRNDFGRRGGGGRGR